MKRPLPFHSNAVWPPPWVMVTFVISCGLISAVIWLIAAVARMDPQTVFAMQEIVIVWKVLLGAAAGFYAVYRLGRFHPACNRGYREWLKLSPWTAAKPLPLGPAHLVWQDAAVVGALAAIAGYAHVNPLLPVGVFGLIYGGGMTFLLGLTGSGACLVLGFLWPALMLPAMSGWPMTAIIVVLLAVIWLGHQKSLKRFPWPNLGEKSVWQTDITIGGMPNAGWPYSRLSPKFSSSPVSIAASFLVSILIGWWFYCLNVYLQSPPEMIQFPPEVILVFGVAAALFRVLGYCMSITTPFNLWGRLVTGRLIVPGFDRVFLTPLAVVLLAIVGDVVIKHSETWCPVAESFVFALLWFVLLAGGPTYRKWILSGQHRYRTPPISNTNKRLFKSI